MITTKTALTTLAAAAALTFGGLSIAQSYGGASSNSVSKTPAGSAAGQEAATVKVSQSKEYGEHLTDAQGRSLYMFTTDTQGHGDTKAKVSCTGACLGPWPPLYSKGQPEAGPKADGSKLGTIQHDGKMIVTYNGWPLYHFVKDTGPGQTEGQGKKAFGGEWYLVSAEGNKIEHAESASAGGSGAMGASSSNNNTNSSTSK